MTEIQVVDEGGASFKLLDFGTFRSSLFGRTPEEIADIRQKLPTFQFRDGDVLLLGYPKAGSTWTFEILTMLLKGKAEGSGRTHIYPMLEASPAESMDALPSPRFLNTHLPCDKLPESVKEKRVKIVFVARNPKDLAVSLFNMMAALKHYNYEGKFSDWLPLFIRGDLAHVSYFDFLKGYEEMYLSGKHDMFIVYYEDLKKDTLAEIKRLADFLGLTLAPELLVKIAKKCHFQEMKEEFKRVNLGETSYKANTGYGFMRKGEVGNWKEWFTVAENENMDSVIHKKLQQSIFKFKYEL